MDGLEATRQIRRMAPVEPRPRIIAVTAKALQGERELCLRAGMDDYLTKPIRLHELIEALRRDEGSTEVPTAPAVDPDVLGRFIASLGARGAESAVSLIDTFLDHAAAQLASLRQAPCSCTRPRTLDARRTRSNRMRPPSERPRSKRCVESSRARRRPTRSTVGADLVPRITSELERVTRELERIRAGVGSMTAGASVLVVDDDPVIRSMLTASLEASGHRVTTADSGSRALDLVRAEGFDVVLLDVLMPGMNGDQVLEQLKGDPETAAHPGRHGHGSRRRWERRAVHRARCGRLPPEADRPRAARGEDQRRPDEEAPP